MNFLRRIQLYLLKRNNPAKYAREKGVTVGDKCKFIGSPDFGSEPWLISIGNHTEISCQVAFITHDGATWVFRDDDEYKNIVKFGRIKVGNNCFIGARSTILPGVTIGDNSIVGACSLVNKSIYHDNKRVCGKMQKNTPEYDVAEYRINFQKIVNQICDAVENNLNQ